MAAWNQWIQRYLRRLAFGSFLQRAAEWFAGFLFVFGTLVLLVKLLMPRFWPNMLWLLVAAVPIAVIAWFISRRECHSHADSAALLDRKLAAGGLLMTLSELPDDRWEEHLPQLEQVWRDSLPRLRPVRLAKFLALPIVFAIGAGFVPLREETAEHILRNTVGRQTAQQLEDVLELLDEAKVVEKEEEQELREQIERLKEDSRKSPLTHEKWETIDALREKMQMRLETASLTVSKAQQAAATLQKASDNEMQLSAERTEQLEKSVIDALKKIPKGNFSKLSTAAREDLQRLMKNGRFDQSQSSAKRKKMLKELQKLLKKESKKLGQCRSECKKCQSGMCEGSGFNKNGDKKTDGNRPGRGGVTRGRGDAEMSFGEDSDAKNSKFKDVILPPGFFDEPKNEILTTTPQAPDVDPAASAPRSSRRLSDPAAGRETWNRKLRPRHRRVVRRYFDSEKSDNSGTSTDGNK